MSTVRLRIAIRPAALPNPFRPWTLLNRGHAEIILWHPPDPPERFGLTPGSDFRVLLSFLVPQVACLTEARTLSARSGYWKEWTIAAVHATTIRSYLAAVRVACARGETRYRALTFNCFHVAEKCLELAGIGASGPSTLRLGRWEIPTPWHFTRAYLRADPGEPAQKA